jgi:prepilin-type processing-associated H-X9-DG protein
MHSLASSIPTLLIALTFRDFNAAQAIFQKHNPTAVIHLAAKVGGVYANMNEPVQFMRDNLAIDQNILRLSMEFKVGNVLFLDGHQLTEYKQG